jgi:hypothetical protein
MDSFKDYIEEQQMMIELNGSIRIDEFMSLETKGILDLNSRKKIKRKRISTWRICYGWKCWKTFRSWR